MQKNKPELIVMLTYMDRTVKNALDVFEQCKSCKARYFGFKEEGIPLEQMKELCANIKECGKTAVLEVVAYTEAECMEGAKIALECGFDILMGTLFFESVNDLCKKNNLKYMPFVGEVTERPSVLSGSAAGMLSEADSYLKKGVCGFDLLGYRYTGDAVALNRDFVTGINAPVCIAGSVNSYKRVDEIVETGAWAFTVGSAFFDNCFGGTVAEQIDKVCDYIEGIAEE